MNISEITAYLSIQNKKTFDQNAIDSISELKKKAVQLQDEEIANLLFVYSQIALVQSNYVSAFELIKYHNEHHKAWMIFDQIETALNLLSGVYYYSSNAFQLEFIENKVRKFMLLFPYVLFLSRGMIVKKNRCSICGQLFSIRKRCEHKIGQLYMGEMCYRIVEDFDPLEFSIVKNPVDKYSVVMPTDRKYNYVLLDYLIDKITFPYDEWEVEVACEMLPEYKYIGRNDKCPCQSEKKYKHCCYGTEKEKFKHHQFIFPNNSENLREQLRIVNADKFKEPDE